MTAITGITTMESSWQGHDQSKLSKDFARELAGQQASSQDDAKASAGNEKAEFHEEAAPGDPKPDTSVELPRVAMADQVSGMPLDQLSAAMQEDRATTQPVGVTEALLGARVFGWHALAQSYLSELAAFDAMQEGEVPLPEEKALLIQLESPTVEVASEGAPGAVERPAMVEAPEVLSAGEAVSGIESASDPVAGMEGTDPCLVAMASADYWAERSLRFTRQIDGQGVAWLRDYRLNAAHAGQLVRWVLQEASAKGFTLDRIMLNGREAWSSRGQV